MEPSSHLSEEEYEEFHSKLKFVLGSMYDINSASSRILDADFLIQEIHDMGYAIVKQTNHESGS